MAAVLQVGDAVTFSLDFLAKVGKYIAGRRDFIVVGIVGDLVQVDEPDAHDPAKPRTIFAGNLVKRSGG